jgi:dihydrofolate reductase
VDGFIEGPTGEVDWIGTWEDSFDLLPQIDTCILGGGMYPGYEQYWRTILANPDGILSLTGKVATEGEVAYARYADRTPHIVLSTTLDTVAWKTARIVRDVEDIRELKQQPGKDMYAVGGATLVSSLLNLDLIDEVRLTVIPSSWAEGKRCSKT